MLMTFNTITICCRGTTFFLVAVCGDMELTLCTVVFMQVWSRILHAIPDSRIVLKNKPFVCETTKAYFMNMFKAEGVESWRVDLLPLTQQTHDHLGLYSLIDISLDPWPYAGDLASYKLVKCHECTSSICSLNMAMLGCSSNLNVLFGKYLLVKTLLLSVQLRSPFWFEIHRK